MAVNKTKLTLIAFLSLSLFLGISSCRSVNTTQKSIDVPSDQPVLKPQSIPRRALRIKGQVTTEVVTLAKRTMFNLRVEEIVGMGPNFKGEEPEKGEVISVDAPEGTSVIKGEHVFLDISTAKTQTGDNLMFNLLRKITK